MNTIKIGFLVVVAMAALSLQPSFAQDQPRMREALSHLRAARAQLAQAEHNKGGHRAKALELVERAIAEVQAGMTSAR